VLSAPHTQKKKLRRAQNTKNTKPKTGWAGGRRARAHGPHGPHWAPWGPKGPMEQKTFKNLVFCQSSYAANHLMTHGHLHSAKSKCQVCPMSGLGLAFCPRLPPARRGPAGPAGPWAHQWAHYNSNACVHEPTNAI